MLEGPEGVSVNELSFEAPPVIQDLQIVQPENPVVPKAQECCAKNSSRQNSRLRQGVTFSGQDSVLELDYLAKIFNAFETQEVNEAQAF